MNAKRDQGSFGVGSWIVAAMVLLAAGCGKGDEAARPVVGFVTNSASDFWNYAKKGTQAAASEFGVDVDFRIVRDATAAEQQAIVEDLLTKGVSAIAISPIDPANQLPFLKKVAGKVKLVCHDSDAPDSGRLAYVGTDNVRAGRAAGKEILRALPDGGTVMLFVGSLEALNAQQRRQGILAALEGSKVTVIDTRTDGTDRARARANVEETLVNHPDLGALVGLWSYNTPQILAAVRAAGKIGKVKIVGFDEEEDTLAGVADGSIEATIVQQPYKFGYDSVRILAGVLAGRKDVLPEGGVFDVPILAIDKNGVAFFRQELERLRH